MSDSEDKKFFTKETVRYSQLFFSDELPILIVNIPGLPLPTPALVDSGATMSMLHIGIAKTLNLKVDYTNKRTGTGAGGGFDYAPCEPIEIGILGQKYVVSFNVVLDPDFPWGCILGNSSIFKFAKIVFRTYKKEFDIFLRKDIN